MKDGNCEELLDALNDDSVEVHVSEVDRDPYGIMISKAENDGTSYGKRLFGVTRIPTTWRWRSPSH